MLAVKKHSPPKTEKSPDKTNAIKVNGAATSVGADAETTPPGSKASAPQNLEKSESMDVDDDDEVEHAVQGGRGDTSDSDDEEKPPQAKKVRYYCPYNLNERDSDENTPLHVAIHARRLENVKVLLEAGASVHKKCDGSPPLHAAISIGSVPQHADFAYECVKLLDEHDADLAAKDDSLHTPLYLACMYNLPRIVSYLLSKEAGKSTLNVRADRSQGRALHASAKFNTATNTPRKVAASAHARTAQQLHHPDGSVANAMHHIPGFPGKQADRQMIAAAAAAAGAAGEANETTTQILLKMEGIEIDAQNSVGQTPLHVACSRGNWNAVRELLDAGANPDTADRRGYTPGQFAHKRGVVIPNDLLETLGGPPSSGIVPPPRDLIVDPDSNTLLITHELCILHRTCPQIRRDSPVEPPPENVRRLQVLVDQDTGILRTGEFSKCNWQGEARRAALVDVFKVRKAAIRS
jgi:ankyrin repeat protein